LAPLLTIGGAAGALLGALILTLFPDSGISIPMAALVGMSSMFAGASRAYLTSITFALESTGQFHALLPLLGACTAAYIVSFFLMENTIMTEKIARRGVVTPDSYEPDILGKLKVAHVIKDTATILDPGQTIREVRNWLKKSKIQDKYFISADKKGNYLGIVTLQDINQHDLETESLLNAITHTGTHAIDKTDSLRKAVELLSKGTVEVLPVIMDHQVIGLLSHKDIIDTYKSHQD
jgi:CIC family chloride channel protein